jgi:eukaryotic-like serine/threonine-protein kinase
VHPPSPQRRPARPRSCLRALGVLLFGFFVCSACTLVTGLGWFAVSRAFFSFTGTTYIHAGESITALAWSPDTTSLATVRNTATEEIVEIWNTATGDMRTSYHLSSPDGELDGITWSPDGTRIAAAGDDGKVVVWEMHHGTTLWSHNAEYPSANGLLGENVIAWSPDGTRLASLNGNMIMLWEASTGKLLLHYSVAVGHYSALAWSPNSQQLAATTAAGSQLFQILAVSAEHIILQMKMESGYACCVTWSPDGHRIAIPGEDGLVYLLEAFSGKTLLTYRGQYQGTGRFHRGHIGITSLAWSPNGKYIASVRNDVKVWDVTTGADIFTYSGNFINGVGDALLVSWSPDGQRLATVFDAQDVLLWKAPPGRSSLPF